MNDASFLAGKLILRDLPELIPDHKAAMPPLKRLVLPQGQLAQFHDSAVPIHYIAALELTQGSVRGNHHHQSKVEHVYLMRGELQLIAREIKSGEHVEILMRAGHLAIIQPGVAHAFRVLRAGVAIEFAPTRFDASDVHRSALI